MLLPWSAVELALAEAALAAKRHAAFPGGRDADLETAARKLVGQLADCQALAAKIEVHWNARMRSTAGRAWQGKGRVELNPRLHECPEGEIDRTLRHELAHLIAYFRARSYGLRRRIDPHGAEWRRACREVGIPNEERTHQLEALKSRRLPMRFRYRCPVCDRDYPRARPIRRPLACGPCCEQSNGGRYDARFRLVAA
jgi:SprT protein